MLVLRWLARLLCLALALACLAGAVSLGLNASREMHANEAFAKSTMSGSLAEILAKSPRNCLLEASASRLDLTHAILGGDFGLPDTVLAIPVWPAGPKPAKTPPVVALSGRAEWLSTFARWKKASPNPKALRAFLRQHKAELAPTVHLSGRVDGSETFEKLDQFVLSRVRGSSPSVVVYEGFQPNVERPARTAVQAVELGVFGALLAWMALARYNLFSKLPSPDRVGLQPLKTPDPDSIKLIWSPWQGSRFMVGGSSSDSVSINAHGQIIFRNMTTVDVMMGTPAVVIRKAKTALTEIGALEGLQSLTSVQRNLLLSALVQGGLGEAAGHLLEQTRSEPVVRGCVTLWSESVLGATDPSHPTLLNVGLNLDGPQRYKWTCAVLKSKLGLNAKQASTLREYWDASMDEMGDLLHTRYSGLGVPQNIDA